MKKTDTYYVIVRQENPDHLDYEFCCIDEYSFVYWSSSPTDAHPFDHPAEADHYTLTQHLKDTRIIPVQMSYEFP